MEFDVWPAVLLAAPAVRERVPLWVMEWTASALLHLWLFCVGGCVGSFLNVVVYRLPRGKNLAHPGSCCPQCGHPIRLWDNIPILSWLILWGRCRDCRARISPRYFWVELLVASMFLGVALWERTDAVGLFGLVEPRRPLSFYDTWPYWSRYATHVVQITTLIGGVLMLGDGVRPPVRLFVPSILLSLVLALIWPEIRSVPAWHFGSTPDWQQGLIDGLAGLAAGILLGLVCSPFAPRLAGLTRSTSTTLAWAASLGIVLGWQRTLLWGLPIFTLYLLAATALRVCSPVHAEPDPPITDLPTSDLPTSDNLNSDLRPPT